MNKQKRPIVCIGNYAKNPYYFESLGVRVFCMEELAYCLRENAFLLDADIMSDQLLVWIEKECGAAVLARELHPLVHQKGSLSEFVRMILEYTAFYDMEVVRQVEQTLKRGAGLSLYEKQKARVDYLLEKRRYVLAVQGYEELLARWESEKTGSQGDSPAAEGVKAALLHNKGVALVGLMQYKEASDAFRQAWEQQKSPENLKCYLAVKRMELSESDYIAFAAELPESLEISLELEKTMESLRSQWQEDETYGKLKRLEELRSSDAARYYEEADGLSAALKEQYRQNVR